jgi:hypothetical protein
MKTKIKLLAAASLAVTAGLGTNSASALPYLYPGTDAPPTNYVQLLEDQFFEVLIRNGAVLTPDANTVIQAGDLFAGVQRIQATELAAPEGGPPPEPYNLQSGPTFTSIFLIEATSVTEGTAGYGDGATDTLLFGKTSTAMWNTIYGAGGLLDISSVFDITDLSSAAGTQSVNPDTTILLFYGQPYGNATSLGTLPSSTSSYVGIGDLQYEFGFTGDANEFWQTKGADAAYPFYVASNNPPTKFAQNITQQWDGPDLEQHIYRQLVGDSNFTGPSHYQGDGAPSALAAGTSWGIVGDLDTYMRPVPEPTSTALLSLGLLGLAWGKRRMNKAA